MRIFLDANVLVSVVNREYPVFTACAKILSLAVRPDIRLFTSALSLGITWYFACKKHGEVLDRRKMEILLAHIAVSPCGQEEVEKALAIKKADDFEDALQYFSAMACHCDHFVTSNIGDFHFSEIPISVPDDFLRFVGD